MKPKRNKNDVDDIHIDVKENIIFISWPRNVEKDVINFIADLSRQHVHWLLCSVHTTLAEGNNRLTEGKSECMWILKWVIVGRVAACLHASPLECSDNISIVVGRTCNLINALSCSTVNESTFTNASPWYADDAGNYAHFNGCMHYDRGTWQVTWPYNVTSRATPQLWSPSRYVWCRLNKM